MPEADREPRHQIVRIDQDELEKKRAAILGIQILGPGDTGRARATGIDVWRLAGIHPNEYLYNKRHYINAYQELMAAAYDSVFS